MAVDLLFEVWHAAITDLDLFLSKILWNTCSSVNSASSSLRKVCQRLVDVSLPIFPPRV